MALAAALLLTPAPALAHAAEDGVAGWSLEPGLLTPLLLSGMIYGLGFARRWRRSDHGRGELARHGLLFAVGWLVLIGALVSPLHEAGERSFTAHMLEHELLMLIAAPLLVLSRPLGTMMWAFPAGGRRALAAAARSAIVTVPHRVLSGAVVATTVQAVVLFAWHAPALFDLALDNEVCHAVQHACFLVSALYFWTAMFPARERRYGVATLSLFVTATISGVLGALMAFAQSPWYARYAELGMAPFGLTATEDQQLAGLLMWIPGGTVHALAALALVGKALSQGGGHVRAPAA